MADERILATVSGQNITEADVERFIAALGQRGQNYRSPEGRAIVLDPLDPPEDDVVIPEVENAAPLYCLRSRNVEEVKVEVNIIEEDKEE